ncbi:MAG: hypothetical protein JWN25_3205 [Verrucomicrobiales bacterium]|nr:hypothetical protein [Verrucomicrobiales bacterium]
MKKAVESGQQFFSVNHRRSMDRRGGLILALVMVLPSLELLAGTLPVDLRTTARFGVLAGSGVSSIPTSSVKGDVGLSPAARSKITGLTAVEVTGAIYAADDGGAVAAMLTAAKGDLNTAFIDASPATRPGGIDVSSLGGAAEELGGRTLAPGVYKSAPGFYNITSLDLVLDGKGDANAVWIFQTSTTLHALDNRKVLLIGGAQARNVFWQVGTSATISTFASFKGTIMAAQSIAIQTSAALEGRALAQTGAVTLDSNAITIPVIKPLPPTFGPLARAGNGVVTLVITNTPGVTITLQSSANLVDWFTIGSPQPSVSPFTMNDANVSAETKRSYRAFYP